MRARGFLLSLAVLLLLCGCSSAAQEPAEAPSAEEASAAEETPRPPEAAEQEDTKEQEEEMKMKLQIGDTPVEVRWEDNKSVEALRALAAQEPLSIALSMYGGFEQVGSIGQRLPRDDVQTTTSAGDIVLYAGNQIVIFYGSNAWAYTRLGHITDRDAAEMEALLGSGDVSITISAEEAEP